MHFRFVIRVIKECYCKLWHKVYFFRNPEIEVAFWKTYFLLKGLFTIFKIFTQICIINIKQNHYARFKVWEKKTAKFSWKLLWTWHRIWTVLCVTWNKWTILLNILFLTLSIYLFLIFYETHYLIHVFNAECRS